MTADRVSILIVAGTRPEAIKLAPLVLAASGRGDVAIHSVATGQHPAMFAAAFAAFGLTADQDLGSSRPGDTIDTLANRIECALPPILRDRAPDIVVVQGDTTSAWAGARAAFGAGFAVAHVEAGLRSGDPALPWPEERNRRAIDAISALLFAPTAGAADNLRAERLGGAVHVTGNTAIDALLWMRSRIPAAPPADMRTILATVHRREAIAHIPQICAALRQLAARGDVRVTVPIHPNPEIARRMNAELAGAAGIVRTPPLAYPAMIAAMMRAHLILTDSGGVQEEAPALGIPTLVMRDVTERPEALASGNLAMVGTDPDAILAAAGRLLDDPAAHAAMARPAYPYGDGTAAPRILDAIVAHALSQPARAR